MIHDSKLDLFSVEDVTDSKINSHGNQISYYKSMADKCVKVMEVNQSLLPELVKSLKKEMLLKSSLRNIRKILLLVNWRLRQKGKSCAIF